MSQTNSPEWERSVLEKLANGALIEQRRTRRWNIFFRVLVFAYLFLLLFLYNPQWQRFFTKLDFDTTKKHTALVELKGVIAAGSDASADNVITGLRHAFGDENTAGVILRINSPGGSPVQSGYINDEIKRLRAKYPDIKLYAVIVDIGASGAYYAAAAADMIYADKASIVGSIGVILANGFGFVEAMEKLGIERRLLSAGENKGFLDPFSPLRQQDVKHIKEVLDNMHQQFIDTVKAGRGERLSADPAIFSGLIWTGEQAVELGLVDDLASSSSVARNVIKAEKIVDFTPEPNVFDRIAKRIGMTLGDALIFDETTVNGGALPK